MQKKKHFSVFHKLFLPSSFRPGVTISSGRLGLLALASFILLLLSRVATFTYPHPRQADMQKAAGQMQQAMRVINEHHQHIYPVDRQSDPLQSGFIGVEFSPITTTLGDLSAKINSTNPDFAALFVYWFYELSLPPGSKVVIQTSGSFPALGIACIIAAETYGLRPVIFSSAGASSFGANLPRFTFWDMENILYSKGIIRHRSTITTPGGQNDNGSSFWPGGMKMVRRAAERNGYTLIVPESLDKAVDMKMKQIEREGNIAVFINIGGNQSSVGPVPCALKIPGGIIREPLPCGARSEIKGLIQRLNERGIPVIHVLHIKDLAVRYGMTLSPGRQTAAGGSGFYFIEKKPLALLSSAIGVLIILWWLIFTTAKKAEKPR